MKTSIFCHLLRRVILESLRYATNLYTTRGLSILSHGIISLTDVTSCDKRQLTLADFYYCSTWVSFCAYISINNEKYCYIISGRQITTMECVDTRYSKIVIDAWCFQLPKPHPLSTACNTQPCPPR